MSTETQTKRICAVCDYVFTGILVGAVLVALNLMFPVPWWLNAIIAHHMTAQWFIDTA